MKQIVDQEVLEALTPMGDEETSIRALAKFFQIAYINGKPSILNYQTFKRAIGDNPLGLDSKLLQQISSIQTYKDIGLLYGANNANLQLLKYLSKLKLGFDIKYNFTGISYKKQLELLANKTMINAIYFSPRKLPRSLLLAKTGQLVQSNIFADIPGIGAGKPYLFPDEQKADIHAIAELLSTYGYFTKPHRRVLLFHEIDDKFNLQVAGKVCYHMENVEAYDLDNIIIEGELLTTDERAQIGKAIRKNINSSFKQLNSKSEIDKIIENYGFSCNRVKAVKTHNKKYNLHIFCVAKNYITLNSLQFRNFKVKHKLLYIMAKSCGLIIGGAYHNNSFNTIISLLNKYLGKMPLMSNNLTKGLDIALEQQIEHWWKIKEMPISYAQKSGLKLNPAIIQFFWDFLSLTGDIGFSASKFTIDLNELVKNTNIDLSICLKDWTSYCGWNIDLSIATSLKDFATFRTFKEWHKIIKPTAQFDFPLYVFSKLGNLMVLPKIYIRGEVYNPKTILRERVLNLDKKTEKQKKILKNKKEEKDKKDWGTAIPIILDLTFPVLNNTEQQAAIELKWQLAVAKPSGFIGKDNIYGIKLEAVSYYEHSTINNKLLGLLGFIFANSTNNEKSPNSFFGDAQLVRLPLAYDELECTKFAAVYRYIGLNKVFDSQYLLGTSLLSFYSGLGCGAFIAKRLTYLDKYGSNKLDTAGICFFFLILAEILNSVCFFAAVGIKISFYNNNLILEFKINYDWGAMQRYYTPSVTTEPAYYLG